MNKKIAFVAALLIAPGLVACSHKPPTPVLMNPDGTVVDAPPAPRPEDEQLAQSMLDDATALRAKNDAVGAKAKEDEILKTYPGTLAAARVFAARGEEAEKAGRLDEAIGQYEKLLFYRPSFEQIDAIRERYAALLLKVGRDNDAAAMLMALYKSAQTPADKARLGQSLAQALGKTDQGKEALEILVALAYEPSLPAATRDQYKAQALEILDGSLSFKDASSLWSKVQGDSQWQELVPALGLKLAKIYAHVRDFVNAQEMAELVATKYPKSPYATTARDFLGRLKSRFMVDTRAVGVLLPLSGKYKQYGERSLTAIKLAFKSDPSFKLIVKDTQGEPTMASQAVEDLVLNDHVVAIIGPLFSTEAQAAALKAEELSVPLVALSHKEGLPELGPFVFRTALTIQAQAKELARVAFENLGFSRFALLYPRNSYGQEFARAFWDEVDKRKGEIRAVETYEIDQTTFMEPIKKLVGRYYTSARYDYREQLAAIRAKGLPNHRVQSELEKVLKGLPPVIDFDAIIIPDAGKNIGLIAPALAFEDIVLTQDPKELERIKKSTNNKNVKPVMLLGASTWNTPQTVESCEKYCEGAVFVDAYYPDNPEPKVRDFVTAYTEAATIPPHLSEAQAYDSAGLLRWVITSQKPADRNALQNALLKAGNYEGVTGKGHFDQEGEAQKTLFVLTIEEGMIKPWSPKAEPPRG